MRAGARRLGLWEPLALAAVLAAAVLGLAAGDWLWRLDRVLFDASLRLARSPPAADIVIVAVDEQSLRALGRWPWPREHHAELIERLAADGARAIAFDLIFAEPAPGDARLGAALRASARVVLPVLLEQPRLGGFLVERLPVAPLAASAAGLGHVHVELDRDGIARGLYLREGLGAPRWPALALELARVARGEPAPAPEQAGPALGVRQVWSRERPMLVPFSGPPGTFPRISYAQVLAGEFLPGTFRDKRVLVGITATGLGDALPTPVSGRRRPMPGVEFIANTLSALEQGRALRPLPQALRLTLAVALVVVPVLLYPRLSPRAGALLALGMLAAAVGLAAALTAAAGRWFAPAAALVPLAASYPLWTWRRLEYALRYLDRELATLRGEQARLPVRRRAGPPDAGGAEVVESRIAQVREATAQIRAMRRIVDDGLARMPGALVLADAAGEVVFANPQAALHLGATGASALLGRPLAGILAQADPEQPGRWSEALDAARLEGRASVLELDGAGARSLLVQIGVPGEGGEDSFAVVLTSADVSALKDSERRRAELLEFLSHDLRAPLVSMLALIEIARERATAPEDLLERLRGHADKTLTLAERFLELARIESREQVLREEMDLAAVALNAIEQAWGQARARGVELVREGDLEGVWMRGDPGLVERAITNLLTNAIRHSAPGSTVRVVLERGAGRVRCQVVDRGEGIAPEDSQRVFERFERLGEQGTRGAGLGLALVRAVAERHRGSVRLESRPGEGARFTLELPAEPL